MEKKKLGENLLTKKYQLYDKIKISVKTLDIIIYIIAGIILLILLISVILKLAQ